jgi:hypothetical protein
MPAQTQAQTLSITINGTSYSQYLVELTIGFESWQLGSGLIRKTGQISLTSISGGVNLDPRDNNDFEPGKEVTVSGHPLAGKLLVLSPPTIEPLLSDIPATSGNIVVNIPVGCALAYYEANEPDDDKSGITLGTSTPAATVIESLLTAAGVTNIGTITTGEFWFDYPIQKQGGGFVSMAGEVAHSCGPMGFLYCDSTNTVQIGILNLDASSSLSVVLGSDDREYLPQLDGSIPPGTVQAVGIRRRVKTSSACTVSRYEESDVIKQKSEVCKYEGVSVRISIMPVIVIVATNVDYIGSASETKEYVGRVWRQTGITRTSQFYGGGVLFFEVEEQHSIRNNIAPDLVAASDNPDTYGYAMELSRIAITIYQYGSGRVVKAISEQVWLPRVTIAPDDNTDPTDASAWSLNLAEKKRTEWSRIGEMWTERVSAVQARGLANPDFVESDESPGLTYYDLITTSASGTKISSTGNTTPPRAESWTPLTYEEEDQLEAEAKFSASRQRLVVRVPYAFTVAQMQSIAQAEGEIVWGRAYQYLVECEPSIFSSQQSPLPIVRVLGAGENRIFLADAIQWQHTQTEDWVAFAGIYLGGSGGSTTTSGSFSRVNTIAPVVLTPTGGESISTTPTGNPRDPLPLDGLVMVGAIGYAKLGTVSSYAVLS